MRWLPYTLTAIWALPIVAAVPRFWYFQIQLLNNRVLGKEGLSRGFFDSSLYNPIGQKFHRDMLRLWWKVVAWGSGWPILMGIILSLVS
jgi:hypothetical protein